jgi:hypothetical protein
LRRQNNRFHPLFLASIAHADNSLSLQEITNILRFKLFSFSPRGGLAIALYNTIQKGFYYQDFSKTALWNGQNKKEGQIHPSWWRFLSGAFPFLTVVFRLNQISRFSASGRDFSPSTASGGSAMTSPREMFLSWQSAGPMTLQR